MFRHRDLVKGVPWLQCVLYLVCVFTIAFLATQVEKWFFVYDNTLYFRNGESLFLLLQKSPLQALKHFLAKMHTDYSLLYSLPLLPFYKFIDGSRAMFIGTLSTVYLSLFSLSTVYLAKQWIPKWSRTLTWVTVLITLMIPNVWKNTLVGLPDIGGIAILQFALVLYLRDMRLESRKRCLQNSVPVVFEA